MRITAAPPGVLTGTEAEQSASSGTGPEVVTGLPSVVLLDVPLFQIQELPKIKDKHQTTDPGSWPHVWNQPGFLEMAQRRLYIRIKAFLKLVL